MPRAKSKTSIHSNGATLVSRNDQASQNDVRTLVETLPQQLCARLLNHPEIGNLVEILLDLGRKPEADFGDHRDHIRTTTVSAQELQHVVSRVDEFGEDNHAGIDGTLHRVSCIRSRRGTVVGLTLRVGKAVKGSAMIMSDILKERKSVLFLGAPGVGKTTAVRDVARVMSEEMKKRVVIVDTSNEIGGYGNIPHPSIGGARRMQVSNISKQHNVMIEAVQNHRPEVVIVDGVFRLEEVDACRSISKKGVQIIATTHRHRLENLVKDPELVGFLGAVQTTTVGDVTTIKRAEDSDSMKKRNGGRQWASAFDVLVEMRSRDEWFIHDVVTTVDRIVNGQQVGVQVRSRHSVTGAIQERAVTYRPSFMPAQSTEKSAPKDVAKNAPQSIQVHIQEHSEYFKAAVVGHVSKRLKQDDYLDEDEVDTEDLHNRIMKTTRKKMMSILSKLSQLDEDADLGSNDVLLTGGLELWLRRVADVHGLNLSQKRYECVSQLLASHAVRYLEQRIFDLQPASEEYEEYEDYEEYEESEEYDDTRRDDLEEGLRPLLNELIEEQAPYKWYDGDTLHDKMLAQLEKIWDSPEDIGTIYNTFNMRTDAQEELYLHLRKIIAYAGQGVKGVGGEQVKAHALHLTGVANSMVGEL